MWTSCLYRIVAWFLSSLVTSCYFKSLSACVFVLIFSARVGDLVCQNILSIAFTFFQSVPTSKNMIYVFNVVSRNICIIYIIYNLMIFDAYYCIQDRTYLRLKSVLFVCFPFFLILFVSLDFCQDSSVRIFQEARDGSYRGAGPDLGLSQLFRIEQKRGSGLVSKAWGLGSDSTKSNFTFAHQNERNSLYSEWIISFHRVWNSTERRALICLIVRHDLPTVLRSRTRRWRLPLGSASERCRQETLHALPWWPVPVRKPKVGKNRRREFCWGQTCFLPFHCLVFPAFFIIFLLCCIGVFVFFCICLRLVLEVSIYGVAPGLSVLQLCS